MTQVAQEKISQVWRRLWLETQFALILEEATMLYTLGFCDQATSWSSLCDKLKKFVVNILLKLVIKSGIGIHAIG